MKHAKRITEMYSKTSGQWLSVFEIVHSGLETKVRARDCQGGKCTKWKDVEVTSLERFKRFLETEGFKHVGDFTTHWERRSQ